MNVTPEFLLSIFCAIAAGFGSYAAIRADLARLHEVATQARSTADKAHGRIDKILETS